MGDHDKSGALPTRAELNRMMLPPPFICRFCGISGGDFLDLLIHSLGIHPINYILLRDHVEAHGSEDGFQPLDLPIPERPRVPGFVGLPSVTEESTPAHDSSTSPATPLQDEFPDTCDVHHLSGAAENCLKEPTPKAPKPPPPQDGSLTNQKTESNPVQTPSTSEAFCIASENVENKGGSKSATCPAKKRRKPKTTQKPRKKSKAHDQRVSSPQTRRRHRSSSRGRRHSPSPPRRKRSRSTGRPTPAPSLSSFRRADGAKQADLRVKMAGKSAERCEHNRQHCRVFPKCLGRHCPSRHPPCRGTNNGDEGGCLRRNDCAFEHPEYEKACFDCLGRQRPPSWRRLLFHCPHKKVVECRHFWNGKCMRGTACPFIHGECPDAGCTKGYGCVFDHVKDAFYMCLECANLSNRYKVTRRFALS